MPTSGRPTGTGDARRTNRLLPASGSDRYRAVTSTILLGSTDIGHGTRPRVRHRQTAARLQKGRVVAGERAQESTCLLPPCETTRFAGGQTGGPKRNSPAAYRESPVFSGPPLRLAPGRGTTPPIAERLRPSRRCSEDNTLAVMKRWAARSAPDGARALRPSPAAPHALPTPPPALGTRAAPCYRPERHAECDDAPAPARRTRP